MSSKGFYRYFQMGESFEVGYRSVPEKSHSFKVIPMPSDFLTESKDLIWRKPKTFRKHLEISRRKFCSKMCYETHEVHGFLAIPSAIPRCFGISWRIWSCHHHVTGRLKVVDGRWLEHTFKKRRSDLIWPMNICGFHMISMGYYSRYDLHVYVKINWICVCILWPTIIQSWII